jgi:hypothetical protein
MAPSIPDLVATKPEGGNDFEKSLVSRRRMAISCRVLVEAIIGTAAKTQILPYVCPISPAVLKKESGKLSRQARRLLCFVNGVQQPAPLCRDVNLWCSLFFNFQPIYRIEATFLDAGPSSGARGACAS